MNCIFRMQDYTPPFSSRLLAFVHVTDARPLLDVAAVVIECRNLCFACSYLQCNGCACRAVREVREERDRLARELRESEEARRREAREAGAREKKLTVRCENDAKRASELIAENERLAAETRRKEEDSRSDESVSREMEELKRENDWLKSAAVTKDEPVSDGCRLRQELLEAHAALEEAFIDIDQARSGQEVAEAASADALKQVIRLSPRRMPACSTRTPPKPTFEARVDVGVYTDDLLCLAGCRCCQGEGRGEVSRRDG